MSTNTPEKTPLAVKLRSWPKFLTNKRTQAFYGMFSVILVIFVFPVGFIMSLYYIFTLDDSVERAPIAKFSTWAAFGVSIAALIIGTILYLSFLT